ncbi:DNA cytosine methyltransferase [Virgibacillus salarius]|uniref:DNA cytosine methyltransferase n=1 Tax=Virgibacillus salarius TaxID=447199 RepID=UPI00249259C9|nr:DNA cytosine methyltransferase [Virgibacillus salarius]WBX80141.1 DNA cytosine methyltransferase [Virgibacillus salarius]
MKFLDLFAGIGGFRLGMEMAGHKCVGFVEIDKFARKSYDAIFNTKGEWTANDITNVTDDDIQLLKRKRIDVICGGFPCQAFSVAGKRGGFQDTRGTMFFEVARIAKQIKPCILFLENVKGLLSHDKGKTFATILNTLDELGYDAEWQVLNSKDFGVPQNRERVFIIGHLRGTGGREVFPITGENGMPSKVVGMLDIKGQESIRRVYDVGGAGPSLTTMQGGNRQPKILDDQGRTKKKHKLQHYAPTLRRESHGNEPKVVQPVLTPERLEKRQNGRRFKENGEPMFTLTSQDRHGVMVAGNVNPSGKGMNGQVYKSLGLSPTLTTNKGEGPKIIQNPRVNNKGGLHQIAPTITCNSYQDNNHLNDGYRIRKLTPRECWRLQGFPDWTFDKASEVNSDSQLYKQAGNSVTVNVIYEIARKLEVKQ